MAIGWAGLASILKLLPELAAGRNTERELYLAEPREYEGLGHGFGLGTGTTLGTVAAYPFERIDVAAKTVKIETETIRAAVMNIIPPQANSSSA